MSVIHVYLKSHFLMKLIRRMKNHLEKKVENVFLSLCVLRACLQFENVKYF